MARRKKYGEKRDWTPREQRLVSEFVARYFAGADVRLHVHLGGVLPRWRGQFSKPSDLGMVGLFRRWADAVILLENRVILLEGKILPQPGVISQLDLYERLFPKTPELSEHAHKPIEKTLLCAVEDPLVTQMAREQNIRVVVYRPEWIDGYLDILEQRKKQPSSTTLE